MVRWRVRGRVQGVGFRWFVMRAAVRLGLVGYVRNLPDGSVEVVAGGTRAVMDQLEEMLARGPAMARVDGVEKQEITHEMKLPNPFDVN
ncbi:MAG: acylphosphatase [Gemmatimonadales bacterium]